MTTVPDRETVRNWIDRDIVQQIEEVSDPGEEFNYLVQLSGMNFHVGKAAESGSLSIASTIEFDPETLALLMAEQDTRRTLLTHFENVLTTAPGWYTFVDADGGMGCTFREMRSIRLEYRIYPDGATQHELMTGLIDMANALVFLRDMITEMAANADQ